MGTAGVPAGHHASADPPPRMAQPPGVRASLPSGRTTTHAPPGGGWHQARAVAGKLAPSSMAGVTMRLPRPTPRALARGRNRRAKNAAPPSSWSAGTQRLIGAHARHTRAPDQRPRPMRPRSVLLLLAHGCTQSDAARPCCITNTWPTLLAGHGSGPRAGDKPQALHPQPAGVPPAARLTRQ